VANTGETDILAGFWLDSPHGKNSLGKSMYRQLYNIKPDLSENSREDMR
jgi:hypothetical protein